MFCVSTTFKHLRKLWIRPTLPILLLRISILATYSCAQLRSALRVLQESTRTAKIPLRPISSRFIETDWPELQPASMTCWSWEKILPMTTHRLEMAYQLFSLQTRTMHYTSSSVSHARRRQTNLPCLNYLRLETSIRLVGV